MQGMTKTQLNPPTHKFVKRVIPPLAVWAVTKVLEIPRVRNRMRRVDEAAYERRVLAKRSVRKVLRNAASNRVWLAAGAAAFALGIGLMARAGRPK